MKVHVSRCPVEIPAGERLAASFEEALALLRGAGEENTLIVHGGTYYGTALRLTPEDSGLTIAAAGGERPVLSGAVPVSGWVREGAWFTAKAPAADFRLLLTADGRYLQKARYPLSGSLLYKTVFRAAAWVGSHAGGWQRPLADDELNHFEYDPADIPDDFDAASAEVQVYHSWNESYCRIARHDRGSHIFWLTPNCTYPPGYWKPAYAIYNTKEGMLEDGRWFCDRSAGVIHYRPFPGERAADFRAFVPVTTRVIDLVPGCRDITIRGLVITGATTPVVNEQYRHPCQRGGAGFGVMEQDGAISGEGVERVSIEDCEVSRTGGYGIMLRGEELHVRRCRFTECGAGGVGLTSADRITADTRDDARWSCVEDCRIERIGLDYYGAPGIFSNSAMVRRNYVAHTPYTSIIANGDWLVVEDNICIDPMERLDDGGCIYMHINRGSIVRRNVCISSHPPHPERPVVWGIYLDSETEGFELYENYIRGFARPMADARRGGRNRWHHNTFEYAPMEGGPAQAMLYLPCDKEIGLDHNIIRAPQVLICANLELLEPARDFTDNTIICDQLLLKKYDGSEWVKADAPAERITSGTTVIAPYTEQRRT